MIKIVIVHLCFTDIDECQLMKNVMLINMFSFQSINSIIDRVAHR